MAVAYFIRFHHRKFFSTDVAWIFYPDAARHKNGERVPLRFWPSYCAANGHSIGPRDFERKHQKT